MQKKSILVDTNVFISAFKKGNTKSTKLFVKFVTDDDIDLTGNIILFEEYNKYAKLLGPKSEQFFKILQDKSRLIKPEKEDINKCKCYFDEFCADIIHAATCLKENAILITNDKDFDKIKKSGIIEVWDISKAIYNFL